jgi:integrase
MGRVRRRQAGEGGISEYETKAGPRFLIKYSVTRDDGRKQVVLKRGFLTRREAAAALRAEVRKGLTGTAVDAWMRGLEASGRADGQGGLSPRTVRYVFTILRSALGDAVRHGRLAVNPTDRSTPPTPSQARPPEMHAWTAPELARFLRWADDHDSDAAIGWRLLAYTGMRRGEALALRWRDVDLDAARLAVRRSFGVVRTRAPVRNWSKAQPRPASRASSTWTRALLQHSAATGLPAACWPSMSSGTPRSC